MSSRTKRSLALTWTALFVLSLLLQYFSFAVAQPALAAHDVGLFELDGNAVDEAKAGADWENGAEGSADQFFVGAASEAEANDSTYFTTGGSKDENDVTDWVVTSTGVPDKDELLDAYAAVYQLNGETWVYFGADRFDNDGDAQIGFWFFQDDISVAGNGFNGAHVDGDVLILSEYTNGGVVDLVCAYEWDGSGGGDNIADAGDCDPATNGSNLNLVAAGAQCDVAEGAFDICARTNAAAADAPWTFTNKDGEHDFATGQFFEGGINLSDMFGGQAPCFGTFLAETRSSQETDAQLKDFALGDFNTCVPPTIETQVSDPIVDFGGSVTDTATLSGANGAVTGSVEFFLCGPSASAPDCSTGGTQVGGAVDIVNGEATSDAYTVGTTAADAGTYCFRVEYTPDASSEYLAASHTNQTTECFEVLAGGIDIAKVANPAGPVSAGDEVGFDITVTSNGEGTALGVAVNDSLPAGVDWTLGAVSGDTTGVDCAISGAVGSEVLSCTDDSMASGDSFSVHVSGTTDSADCGTISNTASVSTSNDGSDEATASVVVNCPDLEVVKDAVTTPIQVGEDAVFSITVSNIGAGTAYDAVLVDDLPAGYDWTDDSDACDIAAGTLTCDLGDMEPGDTFTVTLTAPTVDEGPSSADCGTINNVADASASNEPGEALGNNSDDASITVACASALEITKSFTGNTGGTDPILNVPLAKIGDTLHYTLTYTGVGPITNGIITDVLPVGLDYVAGSASSDANFAFVSFDPATRTLTWKTAADVTLDSPSGSLTYDVVVLEAAAEEVQPLVNVATIDSDETEPDSDSRSVAVLPAPEELTPPPTSTLSPETGTSSPGFGLMLVLLGLAGLALGVGFITPVPERVRRR
jgi:uncharacterized repeat protein (TIGR01451 family)